MLATVVVVSVLSGGLVVATNAFAQTSGTTSVPSLVQEIADKFHLNTSDVQSVFTQHRQERLSKMELNYETYLQNLVNAGKITDAQKQLILNKHDDLLKQMQSDMQNFKNLTPAERKAQVQTTKQDIETWAKQNNINPKYLRPFGPGLRRFGRVNLKKSLTPTPTQ